MSRVRLFRWWIPVVVAMLALATSLTVSADSPTLQRLAFSVSEINYFATSPDVAVGGPVSPSQVWVAYSNRRFGSPFQDIVVRSFDPATGQWSMRGTTSLNYERSTNPDGAAIDLGGPVVNGKGTVPWVTWTENVRGVGNKMNIFVSQLGNMNGLEMWTLSGQDRANGRGLTSLNINTYRNALNPRLAAGATEAGATELLPWVTWEEDSPIAIKSQIYVARAERASGSSILGGVRWIPVGRTIYPGEPSLNLDTNQVATTPDIAFAGPNRAQPWVVWAEKENAGEANSYIFAARAVPDAAAPGGFRWERPNGCQTAHSCALNRDVYRTAASPRIAAGSLAGQDANNPMPWVAWQESDGRYSQIYVSRFDGTRWLPVGDTLNLGRFNNASTPDITFVGNTPYVTWAEQQGGYNLILVKRLADGTPGHERWELVSGSQGLNLEMYNFGSKPSIAASATGPAIAWQENTRSFNQSLIFAVGSR